MPEFCTCGAQLPPDALFCHKCGKPQREIGAVEPEPPPRNDWQLSAPAGSVKPEEFPANAPRTELSPQPLNFRNPVAVRIAIVMAAVATLLGVTVLPVVCWPAAGFFAVLFYRRRTGSFLDVSRGVRMGWLTGILMSLFWIVVVGVSTMPAVLSGHLGSTIQEQMKNFPGVDPAMVQQEVQFLQTGSGIALAMLFGFIFFFVLITCLSMAGGALGAKLLGHGPRGGNVA